MTDNTPWEGVWPVHSREILLTLTRGEIGTLSFSPASMLASEELTRDRLMLSHSIFVRHDYRVGHITPYEADRVAHFGVILSEFRRFVEVFQKVEGLYRGIECSPYLVCCPALVAE